MLTSEDIAAKIKQEMEVAIDPISEDIPIVDILEEYRHSKIFIIYSIIYYYY